MADKLFIQRVSPRCSLDVGDVGSVTYLLRLVRCFVPFPCQAEQPFGPYQLILSYYPLLN